MKFLAVTLLCALAGRAAGGAIAWPGAVPYTTTGILAAPSVIKTVIPPQTKTTAYSSTQYINAIPSAPYSFGIPQFAVPVHQAASLPGYYSVAHFPQANNVYYTQPGFSGIFTGLGLAPAAPATPEGPNNLFPSQPSTPVQQDQSFGQQNGDADSAVIDSADFSDEAQRKEKPMGSDSPSQEPSQPSSSHLPPATTFPNFPAIPQVPQGPSYQNPQGQPPHGISQSPQIPSSQSPQETQPQSPQSPSFPQFPQVPQLPQFPGFPQIPQGSSPLPSLPQSPGFPQFPSNLFPQNPQGPSQAPPSNFPGTISGDQGLNDEDTISVESA